MVTDKSPQPENRQDFSQPLLNGSQIDMVFVQGGRFDMGGSDSEATDDEKPVHTVRVPSFFIGRYPVTQAEWKAVMGAENNPSSFQGERRPVEGVSWLDAAVFCNALSRISGKDPCYFADPGFKKPFGETAKGWELPNKGAVYFKKGVGGYRLPGEAEWEYAARGGPYWESEGYRYAGSDLLKQVGWYEENSGNQTREVGLLLPNALGLCDMSGNVWEWCEDQWHGDYKKAPDDGSAWVNLEQGVYRVIRGGGYFSKAQNCRVSYRYRGGPGDRIGNVGFRLALPPQSVG